MATSNSAQRRMKLRRAPRACDFCSQRSVKCAISETSPDKCENCEDYGQSCTYDRPVRKRGAKPKHQRQQQALQRNEQQGTQEFNHEPNAHQQPPRQISYTSPQQNDAHQAHRSARGHSLSSIGTAALSSVITPRTDTNIDGHQQQIGDQRVNSETVWQPQMIASQAVIMDLAEIFFEVSFPIFSFFHRPTLIRRISRGEHSTDRSLYASVMAMCALSSARVRDGALYSKTWDVTALQEPRSEVFFKAAQEAMPADAPLTQDFGYMRACALLAITSIQYGSPKYMNYWLGVYHNFVAVGSLHDESNWPANITPVDLEERRRLFWSTYTLDVFTSIIWGGILKSREASSNVAYPTEIDDDNITKEGYITTGVESSINWIQGWNFITDLYRILEHAQDQFRTQRTSPDKRTPFIRAILHDINTNPTTSHTAILGHVMTAYESLPEIFKSTRPITCVLRHDLFSFQAANIAATVQLVRMVLFTARNESSTVDQKCEVAREVISGFASVPNAYLRAISAPLLHHLAGIGTILGSAFGDGLSESSYQKVRGLLLSLANLLADLEVDLCCPSGTADKLRVQVAGIDEYMLGLRQRVRQSERQVTGTGTMGREQGATSSSGGVAGGTDMLPMIMPAGYGEQSPQYHFPDELFKDWDWSWAFDWT